MTALLGERIAALIAAQGPISVAQYMTLVLHDPEAGYYATHDPFGGKGDFVTAPEISQMFGEMVGAWCAQVWNDQGCPKNTQLVELGPGRGTLMADALRTLKRVPGFLSEVEVVLVEASPVLRELQREKLKDSGARIRWTSHFDVRDAPLLVIANEFFDALPIRQYVKTARGWCERMVVVKDGKLDFAVAPLPAPMSFIPSSRAGAPEGGFYEASPASTALCEEIAHGIAGHGGAALILDYGYAGIGFGETLQAVGAHRFVRPLDEPGHYDLSAHVDFTALADAARHGGATISGPVPQGQFLEQLGIGARAKALAKANPTEGAAIESALRRLTAPEQMGKLFQAMALLPPSAPPPPGFL
ncbi:MAG TPA: SAM-dependent methyltransferase [Rhizomicrobium sp.]|jgi:NADH dehydrogenase [ubiquinone] 1 alpha subcomplex assembly factor 7|nr:SAM-dependent methyltransferase [Rhizomicrobium sp.]